VIPAVFALGLLCVAVGWIIVTGTSLAGAFTYPLDDTYIHMAVARRLIESGTWGVNAGVSASVSSSPLWTLLLSGATALGLPLDYIPLVLSIAGGIVMVVIADALFIDAGMPAWPRALALVILLTVGYVPTLSMLGMEHTWHAALSLGFLLALRRRTEPRWRMALLALGAILPLVRFESLVFVGFAIAIVWLKSRRDAMWLAVVTAVPVGVFILISLASGWLWLPNSILVKVSLEELTLASLPLRVPSGWALLDEAAGFASAIFVLQLSGVLPERLKREAWVVLGATFVHATLSSAGTLSRYLGYLSAMLLVAMLSAMWAATLAAWRGRSWRSDLALALSIVIFVSWLQPSWWRARDMFADTPVAMRNIGDQQRQSARFIRDFLSVPGPVIINDLGYVAYAGGRDVIDIVGLGDTAIARLHLAGQMGPGVLRARAAGSGSQVALAYETWLIDLGGEDEAPRDWIRIGTWKIDDNVVCGEDTVTVYATQPAAAARLRDDFRRFAQTLPLRTTIEFASELPSGSAGVP
jgi:hypothetical protein